MPRTVAPALVLLAVLLAACQQAAPPAAVPDNKVEAQSSAVATAPTTPVVVRPAIVVPPGVKLPSLDFPPGPLYVCETASGKSAIDYEPRVEQLCRRHPEMGPCQYERTACRAKGGRVYTGKGEEVTMAVEDEYDRIVRRVRFQAEGGSAPPAKKK